VEPWVAWKAFRKAERKSGQPIGLDTRNRGALTENDGSPKKHDTLWLRGTGN